MSKKLKLKYAPHCGRPYWYPANEEAQQLIDLFGSPNSRKRKAFTEKDLETFKFLEIEFEVLNPKVIYE